MIGNNALGFWELTLDLGEKRNVLIQLNLKKKKKEKPGSITLSTNGSRDSSDVIRSYPPPQHILVLLPLLVSFSSRLSGHVMPLPQLSRVPVTELICDFASPSLASLRPPGSWRYRVSLPIFTPTAERISFKKGEAGFCGQETLMLGR